MGRRKRKPLVARYNGVAIRFHGLQISWKPNGEPQVGRVPFHRHSVQHAAYTTEGGQQRLYWLWAVAALWADDPTVRMEAVTYVE